VLLAVGAPGACVDAVEVLDAHSGTTGRVRRADLPRRLTAVSTVSVGSRWQPEDRAVAVMDRTTAALDDLDTLDALGALNDRLTRLEAT
jgi:hypothetical protein